MLAKNAKRSSADFCGTPTGHVTGWTSEGLKTAPAFSLPLAVHATTLTHRTGSHVSVLHVFNYLLVKRSVLHFQSIRLDHLVIAWTSRRGLPLGRRCVSCPQPCRRRPWGRRWDLSGFDSRWQTLRVVSSDRVPVRASHSDDHLEVSCRQARSQCIKRPDGAGCCYHCGSTAAGDQGCPPTYLRAAQAGYMGTDRQ